MHPEQVRLLDQAHLDLVSGDDGRHMTSEKAFGTSRAMPTAVSSVPSRIGLRTTRNGPPVTSSDPAPRVDVAAPGVPMAACDTRVKPIPTP